MFEFDGIFDDNGASFSGMMYFIIDDFFISGHFMCYGEGKKNDFKNSLITGTIEGYLGGPYYVQMNIYEID